MNRLALSLLVMLLLPLCSQAFVLPDQVARDFPGLRLAGEGRLRWFGLHIYDATLWIRGPTWTAEQEFALDIRYARNIKASRLVETSAEEMRRLGFADDSKLDGWIAEMTRVLPDVSKGEHLTGINRPGAGAQFYHQGAPVGFIADPDFARAFFAIWLDARTREPGLRKSLIGGK